MGKEETGFWRSLGWREWVVIAAALMLAMGVAAILSPGFRGFISHSATAAWVQALGSVGAIFVAIGVARHQTLESERKAAEQRQHDAATRRIQAQTALKSIRAELESYRSKKLVSMEGIIAALQKGENLPDIPLANNDFQAYRRSAYFLTLLEDYSLGQRIHDMYDDIDTFRMSLAYYVQLRLEYIAAYQANEGRYDSATYLPLKAADQKLTRQAQDAAALYAALLVSLDALLLEVAAACRPSPLQA
ncbi:hypothetical protein RE432_15485 [Pusillimonas sp. SM2304]|uniref:hypothetical protein n=1 Tax=Pusillimonas sp. SM2304 TaxID=3073241 RepID=UPI0028753F4F|nr:hypothetical protein [Pusillimonas sp. SM2304]MDS1141843.1 hypothetical protein [Pusillimonas sp. SM2304]